MPRWQHAVHMTRRQRIDLAWRMREEQDPPATFREISEAFGLKSPQAGREAYAHAQHERRYHKLDLEARISKLESATAVLRRWVSE